jgi:hypothetical protein
VQPSSRPLSTAGAARLKPESPQLEMNGPRDR